MSYLNFDVKDKKVKVDHISQDSNQPQVEGMTIDFKNTTINPSNQPVDDVIIIYLIYYILLIYNNSYLILEDIKDFEEELDQEASTAKIILILL